MSEDLMEDLGACMDAGVLDEEELPGVLGERAAAHLPTTAGKSSQQQQRGGKKAAHKKETKKTAASTKKNPVSAERPKQLPSPVVPSVPAEQVEAKLLEISKKFFAQHGNARPLSALGNAIATGFKDSGIQFTKNGKNRNVNNYVSVKYGGLEKFCADFNLQQQQQQQPQQE